MSCHHHTEKSCIHRVPVFGQLTADEAEQLTTVIRTKRYSRGEFIFREGEYSDSLFVLNHGLVKISKMSDTGKEQILRFLFPGDFFGQFALLQEKCHYANAEVLETTDVCLIHKNDFRLLLESNAKMTYRFLTAVSEMLHQADDWMGTISLLEVEKRLAKLLVTFYDKNDNKPLLRLPAQKKELAALLGTTPETLSRKLGQFEELGFIDVDGSTVKLLNPDGLRELVGG